MKNKKCPYCGKRISYISAFSSRRKGGYFCDRCSKEMRVTIDKKIFLFFLLFAIVAVAIMFGWAYADMSSNPLGILLVAAPLIIFAAISPTFLKFVPLKKYKKSMEARKAGIEYSDNLVTAELDSTDSFSFGSSLEHSGKFQVNTDVFNKIKAERTAAREKLQNGEIISDSNQNVSSSTRKFDIDYDKENDVEKVTSEKAKGYVHIINDVSENHTYNDAPLKKIHSDSSRNVNRSRHYVQPQPKTENEPKKTDSNRYSANRKF